MAEKEPIQITQLPSATVTDDGDWLVFSTASATFKIKVSDFMVQFTKIINQSISDEITNRKEADNTITKSLQTEANTRAKADTALSTSLSNETKARQSADTTLQTNINNETKARQSADSTLQSNIDTEKSQRLLNVDSLV